MTTDTPKNDLIPLGDVAAACLAWRFRHEQLERNLRECVELLERGRAAINHVGVVTGADEWTKQYDALLARLKEKP